MNGLGASCNTIMHNNDVDQWGGNTTKRLEFSGWSIKEEYEI